MEICSLKTNAFRSEEAYGTIVSTLIRIETPAASDVTFIAEADRSLDGPLSLPNPTSAAQSPATPSTPAAERGAVNRYLYDQLADGYVCSEGACSHSSYAVLDRKSLSKLLDQGLQISPFLSKSQRKSFVKAAREPLGKGISTVTDPVKQAQMRQGAARTLANAGRRVSKASKKASLPSLSRSSSRAKTTSSGSDAGLTSDMADDINVLEPTVNIDEDGSSFTATYTFQPVPGISVTGLTTISFGLRGDDADSLAPGVVASTASSTSQPYATYS